MSARTTARLLLPAIVALALAAHLGGARRTAADPEDFRLAGSQPLGSGEGFPVEIEHLFVPPQGVVPYGQPCVQCHDVGAAQPLDPWRGSMMAQSARDPVFYAQLDLANADAALRPVVDGMSDMCLRCHFPVGWLEGRSTDATAMSFIEKDLFGVQCHFCHRLVDPQKVAPDPDWTNILADFDFLDLVPPTFGNGMYVVDPKQARRGPYGATELTFAEHLDQLVGSTIDWEDIGTGPDDHPVFDSDFHRSSNLCGTCHDVSNPMDCGGADPVDVQDCFPIERTWSEWSASKFATEGEAGNCQSCHMSGPHNGIGFGAACEQGASGGHLNDVHFHDLTGGNAWVPQAILYMKQRYDDCLAAGPGCAAADQAFVQAVDGLYPPASGSLFAGVNTVALADGAERARRTLRRSAVLEVEATSPDLALKLTNRTGHKLPTGYPEGRRMWMSAKFVGDDGTLLAESGEYDAATGTLFHDQDLDPATAAKSWDVATYTDGTGSGNAAGGTSRPTKVWEGRSHWDQSDCVAPDPADCPSEFHFVLNNEVLMDNRIPPEGWDPTAFGTKRASPVVPAVYAMNGWQGEYIESGSAVHWDRFSYPFPGGTDRVRLSLFYQTASREYVEALRDDNPATLTAGGFNRGTLLHHVWEETGRSAPVELLARVQAIVDADGNDLADGWEAQHGLGDAACLDDSYNGDPDSDGLANWQEFQLDQHPTLVPDPCDAGLPSAAPSRVPVDLILVLDFSGSMNDPAPVTGKPKVQVLREAVELLLETWKDHAHPDDQIGVVYFGTEAEIFGGTLLHDFFDTWEAIRDDVNARVPDGWTAMGAGLHMGMESLKNPVTQELLFDPANPRSRHMILFSNGMQNRSPMLVPDLEFPEFLVVRDQTSAENPDVTGDSNVVIGDGLYSGFPLAPHTLHVHTVGIGVVENSGGEGWHTLLQLLADQQQGKQNFITDARQLEGIFLEDLVASLKGSTLEYLFEEELDLASAKAAELAVPINPTTKKFSLVISWRGQASPPPRLELVRPDGLAEPIERITRGGNRYLVLTRFMDPRTGDPGEAGVWRLRLAHPRTSGAVGALAAVGEGQGLTPLRLRVHALLDDRALQYAFLVPRNRRVGDPLLVKALATEGGEPLRWMDEVTVTVRRPGAAVGELLARSRHRLAAGAPFDADATASPLQRKLLAAFSDPAFAARLAATFETLQLVDDGSAGDTTAGDGRFSRALATLGVPGHYELRFRMRGHTLSGHPFAREETVSIVVRIGPIAPERSGVVRGTEAGRRVVRFTPRDAAGNLLGPGFGSLIVVRTEDGRELGVVDHLDGSYSAAYPEGAGPETPLVISLAGETFQDGPVEGGFGLPGGCSLPVILLILILILIALVVWLVVLRAP
ncbi:MAG: choice-of-anchor X domain-containing protein [Thermoanaerobaculia bacterium]